MDFKVGNKAKAVNPVTKATDSVLNEEALSVLKACGFEGEVTQIQDGLVYVTFQTQDDLVTQVFKPEELEMI